MNRDRLPRLGQDGSILEGIVSTLNDDGSVNISPMGPIVDSEMTLLVLRPYRTSRTYQNLKRLGQGVFHVTDDVELIAQAAVGQPDPMPELIAAQAIEGSILVDACRWYAFKVQSMDEQNERTEIVARCVDCGRNRDFFGFNRAKHAVVEAAILATRVHLLPSEKLLAELQRLESLVDKTAGEAERRAFDFLQRHIGRVLADGRGEQVL